MRPVKPPRKRSEKRRRTELIAVRFLPEELEYIRRIKPKGRPLSTFIRDMSLYGCPHDPFE